MSQLFDLTAPFYIHVAVLSLLPGCLQSLRPAAVSQQQELLCRAVGCFRLCVLEIDCREKRRNDCTRTLRQLHSTAFLLHSRHSSWRPGTYRKLVNLSLSAWLTFLISERRASPGIFQSTNPVNPNREHQPSVCWLLCGLPLLRWFTAPSSGTLDETPAARGKGCAIGAVTRDFATVRGAGALICPTLFACEVD